MVGATTTIVPTFESTNLRLFGHKTSTQSRHRKELRNIHSGTKRSNIPGVCIKFGILRQCSPFDVIWRARPSAYGECKHIAFPFFCVALGANEKTAGREWREGPLNRISKILIHKRNNTQSFNLDQAYFIRFVPVFCYLFVDGYLVHVCHSYSLQSYTYICHYQKISRINQYRDLGNSRHNETCTLSTCL